MVILVSILVFLVGLGLISPLIQEGANVQVNQEDYDFPIANYTSSTAEGALPTVTTWGLAGSILVNLFKAVFWAFTWMPSWLVAFHVILRFALIVVGWRLIRSGSG